MTVQAPAVTQIGVPQLPPGGRNLVITGGMGTGKSTVGRRVASLLGRPFVDLDEVIERQEGRSIADIFTIDGEAHFRELERSAASDVARLSNLVIATGGGTLMDEHSRAVLVDNADVVVLECDVDEVVQRIWEGAISRPMLLSSYGSLKDQLKDLLSQRAQVYETVETKIDTTLLTVDDAATVIASHRADDQRTVEIDVDVDDMSYPVHIGEGIIDTLGDVVKGHLPTAERALVVCDSAVHGTIGTSVADTLNRAGLAVRIVEVTGGEESKNAQALSDLWIHCHNAELARHDVVVSVGGGAVLDTAGFAAATYARGVNLVHVPTTLLAMVDASVGGKTGIDIGGIKNLAGVVHQPTAVLADIATLNSLDASVLRQGLAEVVKVAMIASPVLLAMLGDGVVETSPAWLVEQAIRIKAAFVAEDSQDRNVRQALNLGHTFAHAIEAASTNLISHGDAVAMGLVAAAALGEKLGITPMGTANRARTILEQLGLPVALPRFVHDSSVMRAMHSDKKRRGAGITFVVPTADGVALVRGIDAHDGVAMLVRA